MGKHYYIVANGNFKIMASRSSQSEIFSLHNISLCFCFQSDAIYVRFDNHLCVRVMFLYLELTNKIVLVKTVFEAKWTQY